VVRSAHLPISGSAAVGEFCGDSVRQVLLERPPAEELGKPGPRKNSASGLRGRLFANTSAPGVRQRRPKRLASIGDGQTATIERTDGRPKRKLPANGAGR
jgi:hypothetical protein